MGPTKVYLKTTTKRKPNQPFYCLKAEARLNQRAQKEEHPLMITLPKQYADYNLLLGDT